MSEAQTKPANGSNQSNESQPEAETRERIVGVAVEAATYGIDRLYSYRIPEGWHITRGSRVIVPFGRGNRQTEGLVMTVQEQATSSKALTDGSNFKFITERLEKQPIVTEQQIKLAAWMRERLYCPFYACLRLMLPREQPTQSKQEKLVARAEGQQPTEAELQAKRYPGRQAVLECLADGAWRSIKEVRYQTGVSAQLIASMEKRGWLQVRWEERLRCPDFSFMPPVAQTEPPVLTEEQQQAYAGLVAQLNEHKARAALLFGVTGSGKTAVYIRLIGHALAQGRGAILLVPEIGLTPQMLRQFTAQFGNTVATLHSALSNGERADSFQKIQSGRAQVVVGTRSAIFAPVQNLGLLILDEEQDSAYHSERAPRYDAGQIARYRAAEEQALVVFGSATPSVATTYGAKQGKYPLFSLTERFGQTPLPKVQIIDLRGWTRQGFSGMIAPPLQKALQHTLTQQKQAILFLNRRGNSRVVGCRACGWIPECPSCSTKLTYHSSNQRALCHYCGFSIAMPTHCPTCGASPISTERPGTQKVEEELQMKFPRVRVLRMDADTMTRKNSHERILTAFAKGEADILLGTQMVTKGLDFPNVTLVGVLDADQSLYAPDYRAKERTFSLITQVVGRAGRRDTVGQAMIQTYHPDDPVILAAARQDYLSFYESEIASRQALRHPPFTELIVLTGTGEQEQEVLERLNILKVRIQSLFKGQYADLHTPVLGPTPASVVRIMNRYRYYLLMRGTHNKRTRQLIGGLVKEFSLEPKNRHVALSVDINPDL